MARELWGNVIFSRKEKFNFQSVYQKCHASQPRVKVTFSCHLWIFNSFTFDYTECLCIICLAFYTMHTFSLNSLQFLVCNFILVVTDLHSVIITVHGLYINKYLEDCNHKMRSLRNQNKRSTFSDHHCTYFYVMSLSSFSSVCSFLSHNFSMGASFMFWNLNWTL